MGLKSIRALVFNVKSPFKGPFSLLSSYSREIAGISDLDALARFTERHEAKIGMALDKAITISRKQAVLTVASMMNALAPENASPEQRQLAYDFYNKWLQSSVDRALQEMEIYEAKPCYEALLKVLPQREEFIDRHVDSIRGLLSVKPPGSALEFYALNPNLIICRDSEGKLFVPRRLLNVIAENIEKPNPNLRFMGYEEFVGALHREGYSKPDYIEPTRQRFMSVLVGEAFKVAALPKSDETITPQLNEIFERITKLGIKDDDSVHVARHDDGATLVRVTSPMSATPLYLMSLVGEPNLSLQVANQFLANSRPPENRIVDRVVWDKGHALIQKIEASRTI
jgi:hypothetical protein